MPPQSTYSEQVADEIVRRISEGEPLRAICRDEGMPSFMTVYRWMDANEEFKLRIAGAREAGFDAIAEDCLAIADDGTNDWMEKNDADGNCIGYQLNGEHVQRSKLRVDARLKLLAKWDPKRYGERLDLNHGGKNGGPIQINISKDDEQL